MKKVFSIFIILFSFFYISFANTFKHAHFSIDDFIYTFEDLSNNSEKYNTIFDNKLLKKLYQLHKKYNIKVTCYCYLENSSFNLKNTTKKFSNDFSANSDWLKFGYHGVNSTTTFTKNSYNDFCKSIIDITGTDSCISTTIRLDRFRATEDELINLKHSKFPILELLCSDDERLNYYLSIDENKKVNTDEIYVKNDITFYKTDFRFDNIRNYKKLFRDNKYESELIFFTHERLLYPPKKRKNLIKYFADFLYYTLIWGGGKKYLPVLLSE